MIQIDDVELSLKAALFASIRISSSEYREEDAQSCQPMLP